MNMAPLQTEGIQVLIEACDPEQVEIPWVKPNQTLDHSRCQRISSTPKMENIIKGKLHQMHHLRTTVAKIEAQQSLLFLSNCQEYIYI